MLEDDRVEAVVVAAPSHLHAEYTIAALRAGKHVVCEKPMATDLAAATAMAAVAEETGKLLTVFQNYRYHGDVETVRAVIESGVLGRIVLVRIAHHSFTRRWDWQTLQRYGGGTMNNTGPHVIDLGLLLFGDGEPEVTCVRDRVRTLGDADDHVLILLRGERNPTVQIEITAACAYPQEKWLVMGVEGGLTGSGSELRWRYVEPGSLPERTLSTEPTPDRSYNRDPAVWVEDAWSQDDAPAGRGDAGFYLDLYAAVRDGQPVPVPAEQVLRQMRVMEECRRQLRCSRRQRRGAWMFTRAVPVVGGMTCIEEKRARTSGDPESPPQCLQCPVIGTRSIPLSVSPLGQWIRFFGSNA